MERTQTLTVFTCRSGNHLPSDECPSPSAYRPTQSQHPHWRSRNTRENPGRFIRWLVTPGGPPHAIVVNSENDYELTRYEDGQFVAIATFDRYDNPLGPLPCVSTPDGKALWIGSNRGTDLTRLGRVDLRFDRLGAETDETEIAALVDAYILHLGDWMKEFNAVVRQFAERETTLTIWAHAVEATTPQQGRVLTEIGQRLVPINGRTK